MNQAVLNPIWVLRVRMWALGLPSIEDRQFTALEDLSDAQSAGGEACRRHLVECVRRIATGDVDPYRRQEWWSLAMSTGQLIEAADSVGLCREWIYAVAVRITVC